MSDRVLILSAVFLTVLLLLLGLAAWTLREEARHRRRLRARVRALAVSELEPETISLLRQNTLQGLAPWEQQLELMRALTPLRKLVEQAGLRWPVYRLLLLMLVLAGLAAVLVWHLLDLPAAVPVAALLAGIAPLLMLLIRKQKRLRQVEEELPEVLSMFGRCLRAGLPLTQALQIVTDEMDGVVAAEFGIVYTDLNYGGEMRPALESLLERVPSPTISALVTAIMIQRETGGNLAQVVQQLELLSRQRFRFLRQLNTLTASNRTSAWIVGLMPFGLAAMLELMTPGYMRLMIDDPGGRQLLYVALGLEALGALVLWRMVKIDI